jgi:hypothetical protein
MPKPTAQGFMVFGQPQPTATLPMMATMVRAKPAMSTSARAIASSLT